MVEAEAPGLKTRAEFESLKAKVLGPKGHFTRACKLIGSLPVAERPHAGKAINATKIRLE